MDGSLDEWAQPTVDPEVRAYVSSLVTAVSSPFACINRVLNSYAARRHQYRATWTLRSRRQRSRMFERFATVVEILRPEIG